MESKKVNIFAMLMIVVMCAFSIFTALKNNNGTDGIDGKSSYELAVENGLFSGTEIEYLKSLQGKDGSDVTIEDIYAAVLKANNKTKDEYTFAMFMQDYYPDSIIDSVEKQTLTELATATALRSTVDICYSFYMNSKIINCQSGTYDGKEVYAIAETNDVPIGVSAGSGVIYEVSDDTAYIITNYHVVYVENYTSVDNYRVYYDQNTGEYFTGTLDISKVKVGGSLLNRFNYILASDIEYAPVETHFLDNYEVYLYGYQTGEYALSATFVGGSADNDIAVLKIDKNASENNKLLFDSSKGFQEAAIGSSTQLAVGEDVIAVGNPLLPEMNREEIANATTISEYVEGVKSAYVDALCLTATDGVVSNVSEYCSFESLLDDSAVKMRLIRVSSAINAGNSGGGLFDVNGRLIGIVNGKVASENYDNVGYAIPINVAMAIAENVIESCDQNNSRISVVTAEKLGLTLDESKKGDESPYFDTASGTWKNNCSVVVKSVPASGVAAVFKAGDVINSIKIGESTFEINNVYDFNDYLLRVVKPTGINTVTITINVTTANGGSIETIDRNLVLTATHFMQIN